jgi:hypothetical protein
MIVPDVIADRYVLRICENLNTCVFPDLGNDALLSLPELQLTSEIYGASANTMLRLFFGEGYQVLFDRPIEINLPGSGATYRCNITGDRRAIVRDCIQMLFCKSNQRSYGLTVGIYINTSPMPSYTAVGSKEIRARFLNALRVGEKEQSMAMDSLKDGGQHSYVLEAIILDLPNVSCEAECTESIAMPGIF